MKEEFLRYFREAKKEDDKAMIVLVESPDLEKYEYIINDNRNIEAKLDYYDKAYNDNLELKAFNKIRIAGYVYGRAELAVRDNFIQVEG